MDDNLTLEVIGFVAKGYSLRESARKARVSESTIRSRIKNSEELTEAYRQARKQQAVYYLDEVYYLSLQVFRGEISEGMYAQMYEDIKKIVSNRSIDL